MSRLPVTAPNLSSAPHWRTYSWFRSDGLQLAGPTIRPSKSCQSKGATERPPMSTTYRPVWVVEKPLKNRSLRLHTVGYHSAGTLRQWTQPRKVLGPSIAVLADYEALSEPYLLEVIDIRSFVGRKIMAGEQKITRIDMTNRLFRLKVI